jgi:hypothetical protein
MEEKDLKQIKEVIHEEIGQVWDKNIAPAFDDIYKRFDGVDGRLDGVEGRLNRIESQMVTKSYLDDKVADLEGGLVVKLRKEDEKVNRIIDLLKRHKVVPLDELKDLDNLQIFPRIQL